MHYLNSQLMAIECAILFEFENLPLIRPSKGERAKESCILSFVVS